MDVSHSRYKVLKHFQWGDLYLDAGRIILIEDYGDGMSLVSVEHYPDRKQLVGTNAIEGMELLEKIKKY